MGICTGSVKGITTVSTSPWGHRLQGQQMPIKFKAELKTQLLNFLISILGALIVCTALAWAAGS